MTPIVFEAPITIEPGDIDGLGHVNNVVYLRWAQEVATAHWRHQATPEQQEAYVWVVLRHEIDYLAPALPGDQLVARTHVGAATGARFQRTVEIHRPSDARLLARCLSTWAALDPRTGRPRRVAESLLARFSAPE